MPLAPKRRWLRFSLRTVFVVVTIAGPAAWLGDFIYQRLKPPPQPQPNWTLLFPNPPQGSHRGDAPQATLANLTAQPLAREPIRRFEGKEYGSALEREMIEASFAGALDKVRDSLAKGARIDARYGGYSKHFKSSDGGWPVSGFNWNALMAATESDHFEVVEFLLSRGASVQMDDGWGATPLYTLAEKRSPRQEYDKLAALFIKKGADPNAKTGIYIDGPGDETILHRAVGRGRGQRDEY